MSNDEHVEWYNYKSHWAGIYHSDKLGYTCVLSDIEGKSFTDIEDIKEFIRGEVDG